VSVTYLRYTCISQNTEDENILTKIESEHLSLMHNLIDA